MKGLKLGLGVALFLVGLAFLVATRRAMRRGTRPLQQVALIAPLSVGPAALIGGALLVMTAG